MLKKAKSENNVVPAKNKIKDRLLGLIHPPKRAITSSNCSCVSTLCIVRMLILASIEASLASVAESM